MLSWGSARKGTVEVGGRHRNMSLQVGEQSGIWETEAWKDSQVTSVCNILFLPMIFVYTPAHHEAVVKLRRRTATSASCMCFCGETSAHMLK